FGADRDVGSGHPLTYPISRAQNHGFTRRGCLRPDARRPVMVLQSIRRRCSIRKADLRRKDRRSRLEELEARCLLSLTGGVLGPPRGAGAPIVTTLVGPGKGLSAPADP